MISKRLLIILFFIPILNFSFYTYPFDDPVYKLHEIQTKHFRIIFSQHSTQKALELAQFAEEEFDSLTSYYGHFQINKKIRVIISSDYQAANGFASLFSFPTIHLYVGFPPEISSSHSYTTPNALRILFRHELTHIITLAFRHKYKDLILNAITYNLLPTVVFTARSFMEGSAIARESDFTYGRLHDPFMYHLARRDILDKQIPSFAQFSGANTAFGSGIKAYTYGGLFNQYLSHNNLRADILYWKQAANWKSSALATKSVSKVPLKKSWQSFTNYLSPQLTYETNTNILLSSKDRRINSLQRIHDKIYFFDNQNKTLYFYDLIKKKSHFVLYGNDTWEFVSISPDEKYLLISGHAKSKKFVIILNKKTLLPVSKVFEGYMNAHFSYHTSPHNFRFTAIDINSSSPTIVSIDNNQIFHIYKGNTLEYFNHPIQINNQYIYFLHSYNGKKQLSRIDLHTKIVSTINHPLLQFPRFLVADGEQLSLSYAENSNAFYKRAIIQNNQILFIKNNIKGELFDSIIDHNSLFYKSSFSKQDNILSKPLSTLTIQTQQVVFTSLSNLIDPPISNTNIIPYKAFHDLLPYFWVPYVSPQKAGLSTIMIDSTGANQIIAGVNINYTQGTPEFNFQWKHTSFPIHISYFVNNLLLPHNSIFQLSRHLMVSTGFNFSYHRISRLLGSDFYFNSSLVWQGRITDNLHAHPHTQKTPRISENTKQYNTTNTHPYTWKTLRIQQLLGSTRFTWHYLVSEGIYGFYRQARLTVQHKIDYFHPKWYSVASYLAFSPPIIPIQLNIYGIYNTSSISIRGHSALGSSLLPSYKEYSHLNIFNMYAIAGSLDLLLYSWEIQNGVGFGELFFNRWAFWTGYRNAFWGNNYPYFHSIYLKTEFTFSFLFGTIPITAFVEGNYAITLNKWNYDYGIQTSLSF